MTLIIRSLTGSALILLCATLFFLIPPIYFSLVIAALALYILCIEWPQLGSKSTVWFGVGFMYIGIPLITVILVNQSAQYHALVPLLFALVFAHDAGSYIIGSLFGTHKIAPRISPKKTWEGCIGGFLSTVFALATIQWLMSTAIFNVNLTWLPLIISILATSGDLFESWLKRKAGIKDVGAILPGHGGLSDRFDSLLPVALFFYIMRDYLIF